MTMEISKELIKAYADFFAIDLTDGSQEAGIIGTLTMWYEGKGELDGKLVDNNPLFDDVKASYFKANGMEVPAKKTKKKVVEEKLPEETPEET